MSSGNEVDIHEELAGASVTPLHKTLGVLITLITLFDGYDTFNPAYVIQYVREPWGLLPSQAGFLVSSGLIGFLFGVPALRLSALYLALATFALAVVAPSLIKRPAELTGGVQGIVLLPPVPPQPVSDAYAALTGTAMTSDQWTYYVTLAWGLVLFWLAWNLLRHRTGRAMRAIRDGEVAAAASGINLAGYKTLAFGTSTLFTAVAGALAAIVIGYVSPEGYSLFLSISFLVGSAVGGIATIGGAIVGGVSGQCENGCARRRSGGGRALRGICER